MPRCEDYPCCGHEAGHCPSIGKDGKQIWYCCDCGCELPKGHTSSLCHACMRAAIHAANEGRDCDTDYRTTGF